MVNDDKHIASIVKILEQRPIALLSKALQEGEVPRAAGVYTFFDENDALLYVGVSGKHAPETGLVDRLATHASGRRLSNPFGIYVCDRFVVPRLTHEERELLAQDQIKLDDLTSAYLKDNCWFRFVVTGQDSSGYANALRVEKKIRHGECLWGWPLLNAVGSSLPDEEPASNGG